MSVPVGLQQDAAVTWRIQHAPLIVLAAGLLALGLVFHREVLAAVDVWMASTAYNHCFLVIPIAAYLVWDRRDTLRGCAAEPWPLAVLAGIPIAMVWLLAERLGIMEGRQLAAMSFVELLVLAVLGWRLYWRLCGPLLYLYFLAPFGDFLTPKLQDFTTDFVQCGLDLLQIPAYIDGYSIEIPEGTFYIAQACAGLRFLIASIAFGVLYALLMYRSPVRRAIFIAASFVVPVIANGFRALGIVALGHVLGSAQAAATDHVLYGWIFFSLVILILILLGLPFREDLEDSTRQAAPGTAVSGKTGWQVAATAMFIVIITAAICPVVALQLDRLGQAPVADVQALQFGADCADLPTDKAATPDLPAGLAANVATRRVACSGLIYDVTLVVFGTHTTAAPVAAAARRLSDLQHGSHDDDFIQESSWLTAAHEQTHVWRLTRTAGPGPISAVAIWVDGKPRSGGLRMRADLALTSFAGVAIPPVVLAIRPELDQRVMPPTLVHLIEPRLAALLLGGDFTAQVRRLLVH